MATASNKIPPQLSKSKSYSDWVRLVKLWTKFTDLDKGKQGPALVMTLQGKALDSILELSDEQISSEQGVDRIILKLNDLYKKDELNEKFEDLEKFESYKRDPETSMQQFMIDFDQNYNKLRRHGTVITDDLLGFKLLKAANLTSQHEQLIKATIAEINYENITKKIKSIFSNETGNPTTKSEEQNIKSEPLFYTKVPTVIDSDNEGESSNDNENTEEFGDTLYTQGKMKRPIKTRQYYNQRTNHNSQKHYQQNTSNSYWRDNHSKPSKGKNPLKNGQQTRCNICQSINHWASQCPDRSSEEVTYIVHELVLHNSNDVILQSLLSETWSCAVLDSGASSTVCGTTWFQEYMNSLSANEKESIVYTTSNKPFRFGDGREIKSTKAATIPANIGSHKVSIKTDIVDANIPLLLSRSTMKKARMLLNFDDDTIVYNDSEIPLQTTSNGLYALPITSPKQLINNVNNDNISDKIILRLTEPKSDRDIALKLHRSFAHPSKEKLLKLITSAGKEWSENENLLKEIKEVTENCEICKKYKKPPPRPCVSLPMSSQFQESIAMDLKQYEGRQILHIIDLCTRLSAATFMPNKSRDTIIKAFFQIWVAVYGSPQKVLVDNGGEFANDDFLKMTEALGINVQTTAAESPWSNGIVERHNQTLAKMMDKVIEDTKCSYEMALSWALSAKNSLQNIAGFSPYQLVLGGNPNLPCSTMENLPALSRKSSPSIIQDNLNALHSARAAFIASENDEKIRRALLRNVRTSSETTYVTGDLVYYKRDNSNEWRGPGIVIGQVSQQVFIKHGSFHIRVHPCRLQLLKPATRTTDLIPNNLQPNHIPEHKADEELPNNPHQTDQNKALDDQEYSSDSEDGESNENSIITSECPPNITSNASLTPKPKIQRNLRIRYKTETSSPWKEAIVTQRAGKATGKFSSWWNVQHPDGTSFSIDFNKINDWQQIENSEIYDQENLPDTPTEQVVDNVYLSQIKQEEQNAKLIELQQWKDRKVYKEVKDEGQECISLRWVIKPKIINGKPGLKGRLCARGFEEEKTFRTDSPTCSREGLRIIMSTVASKKWKINSIDVKGAFLQGKDIERELFVRPPKEAQTNKIWRLIKCVYGLGDAPRFWYLKVREELAKLGARPSKLDNGIFYFYQNGEIIGIVGLFVDDFLWGGKPSFKPIIDKFKQIFMVGSEKQGIFDYIGIHVEQNPDMSITLNQRSYIESLNIIPLTQDQLSNIHRNLNDNEKSQLRSAIGQLNWVANISRPEISYQVSNISSKIKDATINDIKEVNQIIKFVKTNENHITFPSLDIPSTRVTIYSDASFNNIPNGNSQGGYITMLTDKHQRSCPISWKSNKVRRVARSTLAAETLALTDGTDAAYFINKLAQEASLTKQKSTALAYTDNKSLHDSVNTTTLITDRRLRVEMSALREMQEKEEIKIHWIEKENQIADCLTKKGASQKSLMTVLKNGKLNVSH